MSQNKYQQNIPFSSKKYGPGFTTGRGGHLSEPSKEAKEKASDLFYSNPVELSEYQPNFDIKEHVNTKRSKQPYNHSKNALPSSELTLSQHDNLIEEYGGFFRANGKKEIDVSKMAKARALKSFHVNRTEGYNNNDTSNILATNIPIHPYERKAPNKSNVFVSELNGQESSSIVAQNDSMHDSQLLPISNVNNKPFQQCKYNTEITLSKALDPTFQITTNYLYQQRRDRTLRHQHKIKPFKSPAVDLNLIKIGLEKSHKSNSSNKDANLDGTCHDQTKRNSVFNLNPIGCRRPLYSLGAPKNHTNTELISMGIPEEIILSTPMTSRSLYIKPGWNVTNAKEEIIKRGSLAHLIPKGWVEHHYGWIVWRLAKRICAFPQFIDDWWHPDYIINQLLYRYEREINLGHRSILKKIMERDDVPTKHMVLMVADIIPTIDSNGVSPNFKSKHKYQLLLTDGWYAISASMDVRMEEAIRKGKLHIGHKISITGAQLIGDKSPSRPLELTFIDYESMTIKTSVGLSISSNSSCKCPWYTKLGYQPNYRRNKPKRYLESIHEDGGLVTTLDVIVCKKYPMLYIETLDNGMIKVRNSREEESIRWKMKSSDQRQVSSYFRLRLCDIPNQNMITNPTVTATLLVSQASEIMYTDLMEGQCYRIYFLQPYKPKNNKYYGKLHLKTTFQTKWECLPQFQLLNTLMYPFRTITSCASIINNYNDDKKLMDMDIVVYILHVQPLLNRKQPDGSLIWCQTMLVADASKQLCQITLQSLLKPTHKLQDQVIGLVNVWYDMYDAKFNVIHMKTSYETEVCIKPTQKSMLYMQTAIEELKQWTQSAQNELMELHQQVVIFCSLVGGKRLSPTKVL
ncbi:unnamed protein product [Cunninghamella blakesleeana]